MQDKALRRGAHLARVVEPRLYTDLHRLRQIGIVQDHKDIVTAQFKRRFLNVFSRLRRHHATGFFRAGQGRALYAIVGDNLRHLILRNKQVSPRAFRRAGFAYQVGEGFRTMRDDAGMLGDNRVPRRQVRRQHAHKLVIREVPRFYRHQHADGMVFDPGFTQLGRILYRRQKLFGVVGVVAGNLRAQFNLTAALRNKLAHLLAGDFGQFVNPVIDQIRQLVQHR